MKFIPFFLYLLLIGMHQVIWREMTSIYGASINLPALIVLAVALYKSELAAVWFGFVVGIVLAVNPGMLGWQALALALLGLLAYHARERLNLESLYTKLLLVFAGILLHNISASIIQAGLNFYQLWLNILTGSIYTTVIALIFFLFKDGIITFKKIKSIF